MRYYDDAIRTAHNPVTGIDAHQNPELTGKPARWLLDVVLAVPIGSGRHGDWTVTALHRTLIQTGHDPSPAAAALARLLAQLDVIHAAGIITAHTADRMAPQRAQDGAGEDEKAAVAGGVRLRFTPFPEPDLGRHTGAEYL